MSERGEFRDKVLTCVDCGEEFTWSAGEQEFFREKELTSEPKHCKLCRRANKQHRGERGAAQGR